jgi:hypothetical protein
VILDRSFIHICGIGVKRERALWRRGAIDWQSALAAELSWMGKRSEEVKAECARSVERLHARDCKYFADKLPPKERWRLWPDFKEDCCYLDIETDPYRPTLVGVSLNGTYRVFMRGRDLDEAPAFLENVRFFATYFGTGFDLPVLRHYFGPELLENAAHLDVMHVLHGMGIRGGLKASEIALGLSRPSDVQGLSGEDAVRLWYEYQQGQKASLDRLISYNREDVLNLKKILELVVPRLISERLDSQAP